MFTTHQLSTIRVSVICLLLGILVTALLPGAFREGAPHGNPVALAQEAEVDEEDEAEANEEEAVNPEIDASAQQRSALQYEYLTIEVAENGYERFVPDETPVFEEDGLPAYGAEFITQGYIYPAGTITCDDEGCNGVLEDGSPEFPDQVIGEWTCYGYHVGDGAHTESGPMVVTTQYFSFGDEPGAESITTHGYELADQNVLFHRAIIGGTGAYRYARGEQVQELVNFHPIQGVTLHVEFQMRSW